MARILLIEDDPLIRHGMARVLVAAGHDVRVAGQGAAGVAEAALFDPELVLLDVGLPDISGVECARRLRAARYQGPLVFLTADGSAETVRAAIGQGAHAYLVKPVTSGQLLPAVETALGAAATERGRRQQMQLALDDSRLISAAVGILAERHGAGTDAAFEMLRAAARQGSRKITEAAAEVLASAGSVPTSARKAAARGEPNLP